MQNEYKVQVMKQKSPKGLAFWSVILVVNLSYFVALLELTCVSTALPVIINELQGGLKFIWVGSAYPIAAAAFMPIMGGLAQVFGRRIALMASLVLFSIGSALCGAAQSMSMLIAGRAIQGSGAAGLLSISIIILSDLVPLAERGTYNGLLQLTFCFAAASGPLIGGALAEQGQWRWLFYLNLPIAGLAAILVFFFLKLKVPEGTINSKLRRIDWPGTFLIASSAVAFNIGLTWGGVEYAWSSARVIVPLCLGFVGIVAFFIFEATLARNPIVPYHLLSDRTSLSGFLQNFILQLPFIALTYYLPAYFQGVKGYSPLRSGVLGLALGCSTAPISIFIGASVTLTKRYRPQIWIGWCLVVAGLAFFSTVSATTHIRYIVGFEIICGTGGGFIYSTTYFPVLAPAPVSSVAYALSFYAFVRQFSQIWAITIGGAILQNQVLNRLSNVPAVSSLGDISYQAIPIIESLPEPLLSQVRAAFSDSIRVIWIVMTAISGLGLIVSLVMRHVTLHDMTDENWGLKEEENSESQLELTKMRSTDFEDVARYSESDHESIH